MNLDISNRRVFKLLVIVFFISTIWGCGSTPQKSSGHEKTEVSPLDLLSEQQKSTYQKALGSMKNGEFIAAEKTLEALLVQRDKVPEFHINLALAYFQQKKYAAAQHAVEKFLKLSDRTAPAYNLLGLMALENGKFDEAEQHYDRALKVDPKYVNALYNAALLQDVYLQNVEKAVSYYERYIELNPEDAQTNDWLMELKASLE